MVHQVDEAIDHASIFDTSPTTHEQCSKGDGASLVPLVDYLDIDYSHDVDHPMDSSHTMSCFDMTPVYDEYDDEHAEFPSCDAMLHWISGENSFGHIMLIIL